MIQRGDIRWVRFASPDKRRPVLVLARADLVPALSQVPVVPLSTQVRGLPSEVMLSTEDGLPSACVLKTEWIKAVEQSLLGPLIATFPARRWSEVRTSVLYVLGFEP